MKPVAISPDNLSRPVGSSVVQLSAGSCICSVDAMATGSYSSLFVVIATSAATLIGLLFVALSVSGSGSGSRPTVVRQFRAAASFLAFINALTVTLFGPYQGPTLAFLPSSLV